MCYRVHALQMECMNVRAEFFFEAKVTNTLSDVLFPVTKLAIYCFIT
jgi:hypothetical protein